MRDGCDQNPAADQVRAPGKGSQSQCDITILVTFDVSLFFRPCFRCFWPQTLAQVSVGRPGTSERYAPVSVLSCLRLDPRAVKMVSWTAQRHTPAHGRRGGDDEGTSSKEDEQHAHAAHLVSPQAPKKKVAPAPLASKKVRPTRGRQQQEDGWLLWGLCSRQGCSRLLLLVFPCAGGSQEGDQPSVREEAQELW